MGKLVDSGICPISKDIIHPETLSDLQNKTEEKWQWQDDRLKKVIMRLAKQSAGGWDGWLFEHFQMLFLGWDISSSESARNALRSLLDRLAMGKMPDVAKSVFLSGRSIPLLKPDGGIRPIAVGSCLRRLAAKAFLSHTKFLGNFFCPLQMGVSTSNGIESLFHATNFAWESGCHVGELDISNAFNSFFRDQILYKVYRNFPKIFRFVELCYGEASTIYVNANNPISSERGTQQGDPLSPFLFCLAIQDALKHAKENFSGMLGAYMDDTSFCSRDYEHISLAMHLFALEVGKVGLQVNVNKSKIYINANYDRPKYANGWDIEDISHPPAFMNNNGCNLAQASSPVSMHGFPLIYEDGFKVLGGWVGDSAGQETYLHKKVEKMIPLIEGLKKMARGFDFMNSRVCGKHEAYTLYAKCVLTKLAYAMRLHRPDASHNPTSFFDSLSVDFAKTLVGNIKEGDWGVMQDAIVHLPINSGGLGLTDLHRHRVGAYFASLAESQTMGVRICRLKPISRHYTDSLKSVRSLVGNVVNGPFTKNIQKVISTSLKNLQASEVRELHSAMGVEERVFFDSKTGLLSSWLYLQPEDSLIPPQTFQQGLRVWLHLPLSGSCRCGKTGESIPLSHFLSCKNGRFVIGYHNAIYREIAQLLRSWCNCMVTEEPPVTKLSDNGYVIRDGAKRYDFAFHRGRNGLVYEADMVIGSPFSFIGGCRSLSLGPREVLKKMHEDRKRIKYNRDPNDSQFIPLAMGSLGFVGDEMLNFLTKVQEWTPAFYWPIFINKLKRIVLDYVALATSDHPFTGGAD